MFLIRQYIHSTSVITYITNTYIRVVFLLSIYIVNDFDVTLNLVTSHG